MSSSGEFSSIFCIVGVVNHGNLVDMPPELAALTNADISNIDRTEPLVVVKTEPVDDELLENDQPVLDGSNKRRKLSPADYFRRNQGKEGRILTMQPEPKTARLEVAISKWLRLLGPMLCNQHQVQAGIPDSAQIITNRTLVTSGLASTTKIPASSGRTAAIKCVSFT